MKQIELVGIAEIILKVCVGGGESKQGQLKFDLSEAKSMQVLIVLKF